MHWIVFWIFFCYCCCLVSDSSIADSIVEDAAVDLVVVAAAAAAVVPCSSCFPYYWKHHPLHFHLGSNWRRRYFLRSILSWQRHVAELIDEVVVPSTLLGRRSNLLWHSSLERHNYNGHRRNLVVVTAVERLRFSAGFAASVTLSTTFIERDG
jgi:hypothetical protein